MKCSKRLGARCVGVTLLAAGWVATTSVAQSGSDWPTSTPEEQGLSSASIDAMANHIQTNPRFSHSYALLVVRNGTLVAERYFHGAQPNELHDLRSVTKSVLSMLTGIAIERGEISGTDALVRDLLPETVERLQGRPQWDMRLEDLLTMRSGLEWNDNIFDPYIDALYEAPDLVDFVLSRRSLRAPDEIFEYSTGLSQVLGRSVIRATGRQLHDYARRHLFEPLGIDRSDWLVRPSGDDYGGLGMSLTSRDQCKLGQLALQRGFWQGQQLVPADWIDRSVRTNYNAGETAPGYGYRWWIPDDGRFLAIGYGGQYVEVRPAEQTVICLTSEWYVPGSRHILQWEFDDMIEPLAEGFQAIAPATVTWVDPEGGAITGPLQVQEGEADRNVELLLERTGGFEGSLVLKVSSRNGSARANRDYERLLHEVRWPAGDGSPQTVPLRILADELEENSESLSLVVEAVSGSATATADLTVEILDRAEAAGPAELSWSVPDTSLREGGSTLVELLRAGDSGVLDEELTVPLQFLGASAEAADFGDLPTSVTFAAGSDRASLALTAGDDATAEATELAFFEVPSGDAWLASDRLAVAVRDAAAADGCEVVEPGCLQDGRFSVEAEWFDAQTDRRGRGAAQWLVPPTANVTGGIPAQAFIAFSFFSPDNLELLVKVVDGTTINDRWWTFVGKLSDLPVWVLVTDHRTGDVRVFSTDGGSTCGVADVDAFPADPPGAQFGEPTGPHTAAAVSDTCADGALCLQDRFEVRVTPRGGFEFEPQPIPATAETGGFWFFDPTNVEMLVKVLDGRPINGKWWVLGGALTDLPVDVEVTDRDSGQMRTFSRAGGDVCGFVDVNAFE